jgi:hypothetical protein
MRIGDRFKAELDVCWTLFYIHNFYFELFFFDRMKDESYMDKDKHFSKNLRT